MRLFVSAAAAALLVAAAPALAAPPPASAFGRIPAVVEAEVAPNGQRVAILGGAAGQRVLSIATVDQPGMPVVPLGDAEAVDLRWAGDDHVLVRLAAWKQLGPRVAYRFERNISISAEGKPLEQLLPGDAASSWILEQPILGVTVSRPARVLVQGLIESSGAAGTQDTRIQRKGENSPLLAALYSADPETGRGRLVERGNHDTVSWEVDTAGEPRVRLEIDDLNDRFSVHGRAKGRSNYSLAWSGENYRSRRYYYGYSELDDAIYLAEGGQLVRKRLADGAVEPLGPGGYVGNPWLIWDAHRGTAVAVAHGGERPTYTWLDPELGAVQGSLARLMKGQDVMLTSWSADRNRFVVRTTSPSSPAVWYLFDKTRKELSPLGEEYPELKGAALGTTRWITYKARDGLEIPAYLTLPPGAHARTPLIVLPHGGPAARDTYEFDYLAQFLATRGYAVLQPQFRGSWGFGDAFERAGAGEWGGKMQTDLLDGIAAAAATGQVDPTRVCIVGASFGGYAALAGVTLHPEAYRCAASVAGISDLSEYLLETGRAYGNDTAAFEELREELGAASKSKLESMSPRLNVAGLAAPILLIHGEKDTTVRVEQSERMAQVLKNTGKPHELIVMPEENHYFTRAANRTRMLEAIEAFLAKHLPVAEGAGAS